MITLTDSLRLDGCTAFRDVVWEGGERRYTNVFYVLPDAPALAKDASGEPAFDFIWYRDAPLVGDSVPRAGGLATLTSELAVAAEYAPAIQAAIGAALGKLSEPIVLAGLPFHSGTVTLAFAGESGAGDFVQGTAGSGAATFTAGQRATFMVELTSEGAALLWNALERGEDLFHVRYDLVCDFRLEDVALRVWCDAEAAWSVAAAAIGDNYGAGLAQRLIEARVAGIAIETPQALDDATRSNLEELGRAALDSALASTFIDPAIPPGDPRRLRPFTPEMSSRLNLEFSQNSPVPRSFGVSAPLRIGRTLEELGPRVRRVTADGGFFRILEVKVVSAGDRSAGPIDRVRVELEYDHDTPVGERVLRKAEFVFTDQPYETFRTDMASPDARSYRYRIEVYYRSELQPFVIDWTESEESVLVIDLDRLGVVRVSAALGDPSNPAIAGAVLELEVPTVSATARFLLDREHPTVAWAVATRSLETAFHRRVAWLLSDGRRLEGEWEETTQPELRLLPPPELGKHTAVTVIAADTFTDVAQIVVALSTMDASEATELTFTSDGETRRWELAGPPRPDFRYTALTTVVYRDGDRRTLDALELDRPVFVARDLSRFRVRLSPRLLDLGGRWRLALVALSFEDGAAGVSEQQTVVIRNAEERPEWTFPLGSGRRHTYRYQTTLVPAEGARVSTPWQESDETLLVLRPPD